MAGGGARVYQGYNAATGAFAPEKLGGAVLVRTSSHPIVYELHFSNGSKALFATADDSTRYPRRVFLSKRVDAQGYAASLHYDSALRLTGLTDASGQRSTFEYENPTFPKRITRITDPFGRKVSFDYDSQGRLHAITDAIGMTSTFTYDGGTFITGMTTPYGSTSFSQTQEGANHFSIQATGPLGYTERTEYRHNAPGTPFSVAQSPSGMPVFNAYLNYRNAFYWNQSAYAKACHQASNGTTLSCDYTQARIKHFLHNKDVGSQSARVLESIKKPLERRVWFTYPGQPNALSTGSLNKPSAMGRVLDDGTTHLTQLHYNARGKVTQTIDLAGRTTLYTYAASGIDLTRVQRESASGPVTLAKMTWNERHQPLSYTDAAGQTTRFIYNARSQIASVTDPLGDTTRYRYDAGRRLMAKTDALGQTTRYRYYPDGTLKNLTDPKGHITTWVRDIQGRVITKTYADSQGATFTYGSSGRLTRKTDALGQSARYHYTLDNQLVGVDYDNAFNPTPSVRFTYDSDFSRLVAMTDGQGATSYSYYPVGVVGAMQLKEIEGPHSHDRLQFAYDALGRVAGIQNALGDFSYRYLGDTGQVTGQKAKGLPYQVVYRYANNLNDCHLKALLNSALEGTEIDEEWDEAWNEESDIEPVAGFKFTTNVEGLITRRQVTGIPDLDDNSDSRGSGVDSSAVMRMMRTARTMRLTGILIAPTRTRSTTMPSTVW